MSWLVSFKFSWYDYWVWLALISAFIFMWERVLPWRRKQKAFRKFLFQDFIWLIINGHVLGVGLAYITDYTVLNFNQYLKSISVIVPDTVDLLSSQTFLVQLLLFLLIKDFIEWNIHRLLHRNSFLWQFHKLHHSITEMDWIGNMRFHWMEIVVYKSLTYLPLAFLGVKWQILLTGAIVSTLIGHLNHSNLKISWGPLKYIFNSPKMHIWHHDVVIHHTNGDGGKSGQNFAILLSVWDWIFETAYWPEEKEQPDELGFEDIGLFPENIFLRLIYPVFRKKKPKPIES